MSPITLTLAVVIFLNLLLSFFGISQNSRFWKNRFFSLLCLFAAMWSFTNFMTGIYPTAFWLKSTYAFGMLVLATGTIWAFILVEKTFSTKKFIIIAIPAFILFFLSYVNGFIAKEYYEIYPGGAFSGKIGPGLIVYTIFYLILGLLIVYKLIRGSIISKDPKEKIQLRYILYGAIGALSISFLTSILFPIFSVFQFSGSDSIGFLIFLFCISYTIIRYDLLNIKVILTEILIFIIWSLLFIRVVLSKDYRELLINGGLMLAIVFLGILLIRSVMKEVRQREKLEELTKEVEKAYEVEKQAHEGLRKLDEAKNQFLMATQHHLRTPLTAMRGYLDLISGGTYGKVPLKIKETLFKFQISTMRLIRIVNELLDVSQFQLGKEVVLLQPDVDLMPMFKEVDEELRYEAEAKGIELKVEPLRQGLRLSSAECPQGKLPKIKADPEKLKVALFNIVDNAIKYTHKGGVTVKCKTADGKLQIIVQDTGIGIAKEELGNLFEKFFERGKEAQRVFTTGRGIGVYLSSQIIKAHNGKIWAESEGKGTGSAFYIELPIINKP